MAKNKGLLIAVAVVVVAVIVYFSTQQSKVSKTGVGGEIKMGIILGFTGPIAVSYTHLTLPTKA